MCKIIYDYIVEMLQIHTYIHKQEAHFVSIKSVLSKRGRLMLKPTELCESTNSVYPMYVSLLYPESNISKSCLNKQFILIVHDLTIKWWFFYAYAIRCLSVIMLQYYGTNIIILRIFLGILDVIMILI